MPIMSKKIFCILLLCLFLSHSGYAQQDTESWLIEATDNSKYTGAPVANGVIGILPWKEPFSIRHVILNHVFDINEKRGVSRVLKGINPFIIEMDIDNQAVTENNISNWKQVINMKKASHTTSFTVAGKAEIKYSVYALRNLSYSGLITVEIKALSDININTANRMDVPGDYKNISYAYKPFKAGEKKVDILQTRAESENGRQKVSASSLFIYPEDKFELANADNKKTTISTRLKKGETISFSLVGSICSTRDFADPFSESERQVIYAAHESVNALLEAHYKLWDDLWQGDIIIEGDKKSQEIVRSALYNLYSYCRAGSNLSISPMGLSSQGYNGHIFWDSEIWMFPPMLFLNQGIAESMVNYRTDRLEAAEKKALAYGYNGAMFPWESDDDGEEATPVWAMTGPFEHHITADIAIACWNYYCMTKDDKWLKEKGYPLMKKVAEFWVSRVVKNQDGSYSIRNVVGANEYAEGITDNAFTNGAVIKAFQYASEAALLCGESAPAAWNDIAGNIVIHKFDNGITKEHVDYSGQMIKQADANLLGYPLGIITDPHILKKDLEYYEDKIDNVNGPAMTYSIFSVQYARLGDAKKATEMFHRCYAPNLRPPFSVLAETPTSQNPYFATCAGGILQAVINGFGGLEITSDGIVQLKSVLPPSWKKLTIKGVGKDRRTFVVNQK